jgi:hypothetical protein
MPNVPPLNAENAGVPRAGNQSQNAERTCRICLSGAEDGTSLTSRPSGIPAFAVIVASGDRADGRPIDFPLSMPWDDEVCSFAVS